MGAAIVFKVHEYLDIDCDVGKTQEISTPCATKIYF